MSLLSKRKYKEQITRAPVEEVKNEELIVKPEAVEKNPSPKTSEDTVIMQDFLFLEGQLGTNNPDKNAPFAVGDVQKFFKVDELTTKADVDNWNATMSEDGKVKLPRSWLDCISQGESYESPFPGPLTWFPQNPSVLRLRFDQSDLTMRTSEMIDNTIAGNPAWVEGIDASAFMPSYPNLCDRKDAHALVYKVSVESMTTKGLPHPCKLGFWTGPVDESGALRQWKSAPKDRTVSSAGLIDGCIVDPSAEYRPESPHVLYQADQEHICGPYLTRFLQFNFEAFKKEIESPEYRIEGYDGYMRIRAPGEKDEPRSFTFLQWFAVNYFRSINFASKNRMSVDKLVDEAAFTKKAGASVTQMLSAADGKTAAGYQFVIDRATLLKVVDMAQKKTKAHMFLSNFDIAATSLEFLGGADAAAGLSAKQEGQKTIRDELERNTFVGPLSFTIAVQYLALPKEYRTVEKSKVGTLESSGVNVRTLPNRGRRPRSIEAPASASGPPPARTSGTDTAGKVYGTHSFRHSVNAHKRGGNYPR